MINVSRVKVLCDGYLAEHLSSIHQKRSQMAEIGVICICGDIHMAFNVKFLLGNIISPGLDV